MTRCSGFVADASKFVYSQKWKPLAGVCNPSTLDKAVLAGQPPLFSIFPNPLNNKASSVAEKVQRQGIRWKRGNTSRKPIAFTENGNVSV
jgi:hypothetical protein